MGADFAHVETAAEEAERELRYIHADPDTQANLRAEHYAKLCKELGAGEQTLAAAGVDVSHIQAQLESIPKS